MHDYNGRDTAFYTPLSQLNGQLPQLTYSKLLILKGSEDAHLPLPALGPTSQTRTLIRKSAKSTIEDGLYVFKHAGLFDAFLVLGAKPERFGPFSLNTNHVFPENNSLAASQDLFDEFWDFGEVPGSSARFEVGDWVEVISEKTFGFVADVFDSVDGQEVSIEIESTRKGYGAGSLRKLPGDPRSPKTWFKQSPGGSQALTNVVTWAKLKHALTDTLYSYAATRTVFRPYQFLPALKILSSERGRLLVADEVGLGKTIEAGLIWAELDFREELKRVLIVAPASLTFKWKQEMRRRFMREVTIWKITDLEAFLEKYSENPDSKCAAVISMEALRNAEPQLKKMLDLSVDFDLVIFDEAHSARNQGNRTHNMAETLSDLATYLVFLSATPLNLGRDDFFNLMNLLEPNVFQDKRVFADQIAPNKYLNEIQRNFKAGLINEARESLAEIQNLTFGQVITERPAFSDLETLLWETRVPDAESKSKVRELCLELNTVAATFTRTRKRDVPEDQALRIPREVEVTWTQGERAFYNAVEEHYHNIARSSLRPLSFITQMPLRQTCSSIPVMRDVLRSKGLESLATVDAFAHSEDLEGMFEGDGTADEYKIALPKITLASPLEVDSKLDALKAELRSLRDAGNRQALIFTFFRGTVEYLQRQLGKEFKVGALHGGYKPEDRDKIIEDFRNGVYDIVVANQVGSEGLDFQFCNVVVNYDLPWNPMQVEQRIGRIDRFGQKSERIHIINMKVPDTIETDIFLRLYNRIDIFRESIGDLEPILQEFFEGAATNIYDPRLTAEERKKNLEEREVQLMNQKRDIQRLEEEGALQVADSLEIDGLTKSGPSKGKYVGEGELISLVSNLLETFGGELHQHSESGLFTIQGNGDLASALAAMPGNDIGTANGSLLVRKLREGNPLFVTFNSRHLLDDDANSAHLDADIISSRHPLIKLAISRENETTLLPKRYSKCTIANRGVSGNFLADVSLVVCTGVKPKKELWVTAIDAVTGERNSVVEDALMEDLAAGALVENPVLGQQNESLMMVLQRQVNERRAAEEQIRRADNTALVAIRKASEHQLNDRKIAELEDRIAGSRGIMSILSSRLVKAEEYKQAIDLKYEQTQVLDLSVQPVAVVALTLV